MTITREELEEMIKVKSSMEKVVTLSSDGKNLLLRIPKNLRESFDLEKGDKFRFVVENKDSIHVEVVRKNAKTEEKRT